MGRFLGSVLAAAVPRSASRKVACELRTEEGEVLLAGSYERCANEVVKRCKALARGTLGGGTNAARFAWTIVGPDGCAVRTRHAITVLS
jgi:hypothetical protein